MSLKKCKTSFLWQFFEKLDQSFATCKICRSKISFRTSTSNLKRHMMRKHPTVQLEELVEKPQAMESEPVIDITDEQPSTSSAAVKRMTQTKLIKNYRPISRQGITSALLKMFTVDLQPFSVVEDKGFRGFANAMNPMYELPSRRVISQTMIPALFEEVKHEMQEIVPYGNQFCITTDCWTSRNVSSFIAVTAHFVSVEFELKSVLLAASELSINHTAENLANAILKILRDWNIENKILISVSDNASNIKCALSTKLNLKHFGCMAHTLNLIVKEGLRLPQIDEILDKVKAIVTYFKKSTSAKAAFANYQRNSGNEPLKLIQEVDTRWNSTLAMMERFTLLEEAIKCTLVILNKNLLTLSSEEWQTVNDLCKICQPFKDATVAISGETYCTGSLVIPITNGIQNVYNELLTKVWPYPARNVIDIFVKGIQDRLGNVQKSNTFSVATFLDPRFKLLALTEQAAAENCKRIVKNQLMELYRAELVPISESTHESAECVLSIWSSFDQCANQNKPKGSAEAKSIIEMQRYLEDGIVSRTNNPFQWWRENKYKYPKLAELARKYLCALASSVPCERVFSKAGQIVSDRRSRLSERKTEMLIFLNNNQNE